MYVCPTNVLHLVILTAICIYFHTVYKLIKLMFLLQYCIAFNQYRYIST